jgi:hypothetical protein
MYHRWAGVLIAGGGVVVVVGGGGARQWKKQIFILTEIATQESRIFSKSILETTWSKKKNIHEKLLR